MKKQKLGNPDDQKELNKLRVDGLALRDCARLLGWKYGRVSEAHRGLTGQDSDSRDGRRRRDNLAETKARTTAALRARVEAMRERMAS